MIGDIGLLAIGVSMYFYCFSIGVTVVVWMVMPSLVRW